MIKRQIFFGLCLLLFLSGCTKAPQVYTQCGIMATCPEGYKAEWIGGQCIKCDNRTTYEKLSSLNISNCTQDACETISPLPNCCKLECLNSSPADFSGCVFIMDENCTYAGEDCPTYFRYPNGTIVRKND